jgi:hypothetical protein
MTLWESTWRSSKGYTSLKLARTLESEEDLVGTHVRLISTSRLALQVGANLGERRGAW